MKYQEILKRLAEINAMNADEMDLEELKAVNEERADLEARKAEYETEGAKLKEKRNKVANDDTLKVIKRFKEEDGKEIEERSLTKGIEYKTAFLKSLLGEEMTEAEKRAYVHTTDNTGAIVPDELLNKIYTNMEEAHPILRDVQLLRTGTVITIAKHTAIVAGDAAQVAEGVANADEQNTFVNVTLSGKDFSKHVDFSYRLGKMAIPAFEQYLVKEIGDRLGSAMASDIITQIKADLAVANKIDAALPGTLVIKDVTNGLAALKSTGRVFVYANNATFYGNIANMKDADTKLSFIPNYQEAISGQVLGKGIKEEAALADGEILILDPSQFIYNMVQDIMLERDKDIKKHVHTISGFAIAEGSMTNDKAGALLTVGSAV